MVTLSPYRCATEGMRPPVDLEDAALLRRMFALFHGTPPNAQDVSVEKRIMPASPAIRARLVSMFSRSIAAASMFPANLRVSNHLTPAPHSTWPSLSSCTVNVIRVSTSSVSLHYKR